MSVPADVSFNLNIEFNFHIMMYLNIPGFTFFLLKYDHRKKGDNSPNFQIREIHGCRQAGGWSLFHTAPAQFKGVAVRRS